MPNFTVSPNMGLTIPAVGVDPGPDWANNLNASLTVLDGHNHSPGSGIQINPNGININQDLPFNNNNATILRSARFYSQPGLLSLITDVGCLYESGVDLYYNDGNGNQIRITQAGGVAGTAGSIGGLVPPASVTYSSINKTFVFQSAAVTPANLDIAAIILRNLVANSKGLTLSPPNAMASDYSLTLPALPSVTSYLTIDTAGNIFSTLPVTPTFVPVETVYVRDERPSGTVGDNLATPNVFITRTLNTLDNQLPVAWISLSGNQFTLDSGTYELDGTTATFLVNGTASRIQNITDVSTTLISMSANNTNSASNNLPTIISGRFTIAGTKTFELQTNVESGGGSGGNSSNRGQTEQYTNLKITRVGP